MIIGHLQYSELAGCHMINKSYTMMNEDRIVTFYPNGSQRASIISYLNKAYNGQ